jgi:hypothetical protein
MLYGSEARGGVGPSRGWSCWKKFDRETSSKGKEFIWILDLRVVEGSGLER